jgi:hypothetical protein
MAADIPLGGGRWAPSRGNRRNARCRSPGATGTDAGATDYYERASTSFLYA